MTPSLRRTALITLAVLLCAGLIAVAAFSLRTLPEQWGSGLAVQSASATGPLRMEFPELMNRESVEQHLTGPAGIEGTTKWDGNALVFTPAAPLERDALYSFVVDKDAMTAAGEPLGKTLEFRFQITGNPVVTARIPAANAIDIATDSRITIVFDRPMIALGGVGEAPVPEGWRDVRIEPAVRGRWRWLSTYAAEFVPDTGLVASQLYNVTVPAGISTVHGEKTERDESWSFETARPSVVGTEPESGSSLAGPGTPILVRFSQDVDLTSATRHIELLKLQKGAPAAPVPGTTAALPPVSEKVSVRTVRYGTSDEDGERKQDRSVIEIVPALPLSFDAQYAINVTPGVQAPGGGNLGSAATYVSSFMTVGVFKVMSAEYVDHSLQIRFSNPVSSGSLANAITLDPKPEGWDDLIFDGNPWDEFKIVTVYPQLLAGQTYTLTIKEGAADRFRQTLGTAFAKTFTTPDLDPMAEISSNGDFGVFERSKPPVFYVRNVNVPSLEVDIAKISLDEFLELRRQHESQPDFAPTLASFATVRHWSIKPPQKKNTWNVTALDLQDMMKSSLDGGIYAMTVRAPGFVRQWDKVPATETQYFVLTNTALTLKYSGNKALLWAIDMQTGSPIAGADVTFRNLAGDTPVTGKTDAQGFFEKPIPIGELTAGSGSPWQPEFWVTATKGNDFAFVSSRWTDPVVTGDFAMWWDFRTAESPAFRPMVWMQTDREIYRPGDAVSMKGFVRLKDWEGNLALPQANHSAELVITDPQGTEVLRRTLPFTEFGTFNTVFPTTKESAVGGYMMGVTIRPEGETFGEQYAGGFELNEYRKPEYRVELTPRQEDVSAGDTVTVDLAGSYYFGAPLSGADVKWRAQLEDYYFNKVTDDWYAFAPEDAWCWWDCPGSYEIYTEGSGKLDAAGKLVITLPARISEKKLSQILTVEADITDASSQVVSGRTSVIVHKAQAYVGIRPADYVVTPNSTATMKVITVTPDGTPLPRKVVTLTLASRTWNTIRRKNVDGAFYYENEPKDDVIRTLSVTTNAEGKADAEIPVDRGGQFVVKATVEDDRGRTAESSTSIYAWSSAYVNWPHNNTDRIDVVMDKPEYKVGDTAKILVKTPFQGEGVQALVTVERENVITRKVIPVRSNAQSIDIPVTENLIPNAYVSVVVIKPRKGETFDENGLDTGSPAFKIGYAKMKIETSKKELTVTVKPDKERYLPGEKVNARLTVTNADGKPAKTELSLAVVDASVLALTGYVRPDLVTAFYTEHGLGVYTAPMLQYLIERFKPGSKGGGGGLEERTRENFLDTAYWLPAVVTNDKGEADVNFTLPDNATTWQLLAVGATKESQFGASEKEVLATKRVLVRPVRPRFAVSGDSMTLKAIVHNFYQERKTYEVSLTGSGFTLQGQPRKTITLEPDEQETVEFPATVSGHGGMTLRFLADADDARDEVVESIPVYEPGTPESTATWGSTETVVKETVIVPTEAQARAATLKVTVSPSIASYLPGGLEHVTDFPYGCAEQTASAFLPNIALSRLQGFDAFRIVDAKTLEKKVTEGLQTLYSFQRADGGFGYWSESTGSYAPLTAYVLYALENARQAGYSVDAAVINRAAEYLRVALRNERKDVDDQTRAYILFILAETGRGDTNLALNLYERRKDLPVFAKAQLAMALQQGNSAASKRAAQTIMSEVGNSVVKDGRGAHVEEPRMERYAYLMQTNQRATAVALRAMLRIEPGNALIPDVIRWLLTSRQNGHWDTTQSTSETLLAFTEYLKMTDELSADFLAGVEVNGEMKLTRRFNAGSIRSKEEILLAMEDLKRGANELTIGKDGTGKMYYDLLLTTLSSQLPSQPREEGISISRTVRTLTGKETDPTLRTAKLGEVYAVTLTMTVPQERHAVAVESPLPAGFEAVDTGLQTTSQTGEAAMQQRKDERRNWWWGEGNLWYFSHRELRDDRVFLFADTLPAGTYRYTYFARATTPGSFLVRAARIWQMYQPEIFGATAGERFTVTE